jgi:CRISPR-associated endoribonuclease Cas6
MGKNDLHGKIALHSFSWLSGGRRSKEGDGLTFPAGARLFMSFHDEVYLHKIVKSMFSDRSMFCGMEVSTIEIEADPKLEGVVRFIPASPIFVRYYQGDDNKHYTFSDSGCSGIMEETLRHKMQIAGLREDASLKITFNTESSSARTKLITYRGISNRVNLCPVLIEANPETLVFAWNVGIGASTGIGFGAVEVDKVSTGAGDDNNDTKG